MSHEEIAQRTCSAHHIAYRNDSAIAVYIRTNLELVNTLTNEKIQQRKTSDKQHSHYQSTKRCNFLNEFTANLFTENSLCRRRMRLKHCSCQRRNSKSVCILTHINFFTFIVIVYYVSLKNTLEKPTVDKTTTQHDILMFRMVIGFPYEIFSELPLAFEGSNEKNSEVSVFMIPARILNTNVKHKSTV